SPRGRRQTRHRDVAGSPPRPDLEDRGPPDRRGRSARGNTGHGGPAVRGAAYRCGQLSRRGCVHGDHRTAGEPRTGLARDARRSAGRAADGIRGYALSQTALRKSGPSGSPLSAVCDKARCWQVAGLVCSLSAMADQLSDLYRDLLDGTYDCVDRLVLNAYSPPGHSGGGFRAWWGQFTGAGDMPDPGTLMRW